jgi:hypothetical protein
VGITEMLADLKTHLEQGEQLLASHVPALVEWATKAQSDPLVQKAISLVVPDETRTMLVNLLDAVEQNVKQVEAAAAAAAAAPPAETEPAP